ncbi:MAG TPA: AzlD domain-containing protein [Trebonia sp.]|nr:AzlD domain-containing protein [Trebonia sp.]
MPLLAVGALAAITYALRIAGPLLADRVAVPAAAQRLFTSAAAVLLVALAATSALTTGHDFAGWARPAGVAAAGLLAARRAPFPVVVVVAASVTALLRLAGIQLSERARGSSTPVRLSVYRSASPSGWALWSRTLHFSCCYQRSGVVFCSKVAMTLAVVAEDWFREGAGVVL